MAIEERALQRILDAENRGRMQDLLRVVRGSVNLPQSQRIAEHAASLSPPLKNFRLAFIHTYTSELLDPWLTMWGAMAGFEVRTYHAPYGLALSEAAENSPLLVHKPHVTVLALQLSDLDPHLQGSLSDLTNEDLEQVHRNAINQLSMIVKNFRASDVGYLVVSLLPRLVTPAFGLLDRQCGRSTLKWREEFVSEVAELLRDSFPSTLYLDLDELRSCIGYSQFIDQRLWQTANFPYGPEAAGELARRLVAIGEVLIKPKAKVIVLDADNTLWGGIIGEDGVHGIALGPEYPGRAYLEFQQRLLEMIDRGFILALCSKNNMADVMDVLSNHPHQVLRPKHFVAMRVNWQPKVTNLNELAAELKLGLDSFIFVDDSEFEIESVRSELPQVHVVRMPLQAVHVPGCLDHVGRLEILSWTEEDKEKSQMYQAEKQRRVIRDNHDFEGSDIDSYLSSLEMVMTVHLDDVRAVKRLAQLTQKTNQFNLTTRRRNEADILDFIQSDDYRVYHFILEDRFGNSGITGLAIVNLLDEQKAHMDTFLMSCRVIGRAAESAFLNAVLEDLSSFGVRTITAEYIETVKNALAENFLLENGFDSVSDSVSLYERHISDEVFFDIDNSPICVCLDKFG